MEKNLFSEDGEILDPSLSEFVRMMAYFKCAMMEIETKFNVLNEEFSLRYDRNPISDIRTRLKSLHGIVSKLRRKGIEPTVENIEKHLNDVAGVRVICAFPADVYLLRNALLKQDDITLISEKDYIRNPKPNGYRSLHLVVTVPIFLAQEKHLIRVEIQLRTISMDSWASLEHQLCYKKDFLFTEEMKQDLLHCADLSAELDEKMDSLRQKVQIDN